MDKKSKDILDTVSSYEGLLPTRRSKSGPRTPDTYLEYTDMPSMNLMEWGVEDVLEYVGAVSMFIDLLVSQNRYNVRPLVLAHPPEDMPSNRVDTEHLNRVARMNINEVQAHELYHLVVWSLDHERLRRSLTRHFSDADKRQAFMDRTRLFLSQHAMPMRQYFKELNVHEEWAVGMIDKTLKYYNKYKQDVEEIKKTKEGGHSYWPIRKLQSEREERGKKGKRKKKEKRVDTFFNATYLSSTDTSTDSSWR
jgi:hypothetical protein